ncbi:MAG: hypothetical protein HQM09_06835 [Candidatus Riflebacteria bacterium]|nr:hypothetical protein [Candidatus Riflebacteria bacterium]
MIRNICRILIAMLSMTTGLNAMYLGPIRNCELLVLEGSYYSVSDPSMDNKPMLILYVKSLQVGNEDDGRPSSALAPGDNFWLYVTPGSMSISIGQHLRGDLGCIVDDLVTGKHTWGFEKEFTIMSGNEPLQPLALDSPYHYNFLRKLFTAILVIMVLIFVKAFWKWFLDVCIFLRQ